MQGSQTAVAKVKPCSAQLDGVALEAVLAQDPAWEGLRGSAQDVWAGHKEDPQKVIITSARTCMLGTAPPVLSTGMRPIETCSQRYLQMLAHEGS